MSGEKLRGLFAHYNLLDSRLVTERKKASINFLSQLRSPEVLRTLDETTDSRKKKALTWDAIFKKVELFVELELESIAELQASNLQKRQQEIVKFVRDLLKKVDERGPRLKAEDAVLHFMSIIKEPKYCGYVHVCVEYCKLLKNILSVQVYQCDITVKTWQDLITTFVSFAVEKPSWLLNEQNLLANLIHVSIEGAASLYTVKGSKLFKFFEKIFKDVRGESTSRQVECLLDALNAFVRSSAEDCRGQVCRLGESLFPLFLQMWKKNPLVKNHLMKFMSLQICAHHPLGANEDDKGSWSSSINHWKKCLLRLYDAIVADIDQLKNKVSRASSAKLDPGHTPQFIELAADVLNQVFWAPTTYHSVNSTQDAAAEPGAKRQKIELGWHVARDTLESNSENLVLLSWLQVLAALFVKHPSSLPATEFHPFFSILHQLQTKHKRHETILSLLKCIEALVQCFSKRKVALDCCVVSAINPILKQIWTSTLRVVGIKHLTDSGFSLLTTLLQEHVVPPDPEIFCVILGSGVPSRSSLEFLATYLQLYPLPEKFQPVSPLGIAELNMGSYPLRHQLFNWLMPVNEEGTSTNEPLAFWASRTTSRLANMQMVAGVLVSLTQKFSTAIVINGMEPAVNKSHNAFPHNTDAVLVQMERVYLKSTFDEVNWQSWNEEKTERKLSREIKHNRKIEALCSLLCERLAHTASLFCETLEAQSLRVMSKDQLVSFGGKLESVVRFCSLVCQVMVYLLKSNSLTQEQLLTLPVIRKLGNLLNKVVADVSGINVSDEADIMTRMEVFAGVITQMEKMFTMLSAEVNSPEQFVGIILRAKIPGSFINDVYSIYSGEWGQHTSANCSQLDITEKSFFSPSTSKSFLNQSSSMRSLDELDGFDDFESEVSSSEETTALQRTLSQSQQKNIKSVQSTLRDCCARFLCGWVMYECDDTAISSADPHPNDIKERLVEFLRSEDFSVSTDGDLKLYFTVAFALASSINHLPCFYLEVLLDVLRQAVSKFRKDQKVCSQGLNLLIQLIPHLDDQANPGSSLQTSRDFAMHILNAFWTLKDTQYSPFVRLQLAKCMEAFLKVDPEEKWCGMKQVKKDKAGVVQESVSLSLSEEFPKLLRDSSHSLRMHMASAVGVLFVRYISEDCAVPAPREHQFKIFNKVSQILVESLTGSVTPSLSNEESEDEGVNRSSSMLACLKQIALISPICEKRAVALLFQAVKEQILDKDLVKKVLAQLAMELGYSSSSSYTTSHLQFIIDNWLNNGLKITEFPCQLMDYKTLTDFFQDHYSSILANIISRPDTVDQSIQLLTRQVNPRGDCNEFIKDSFCTITSFLFPWFAAQSRADTSTSSSRKQVVKVEQAKKSHAFLVSTLTQEVFDRILAKKFSEQIVSLLLRMYEPTSEGSDISQFTKDSDPEPDPPYFTSHAITATFDYLTSCHTGEKSLVSVLCNSKDSIQKILLSLTSRIAETHLIHEKRRILSMYRLFVLLLLKDLPGGLGNTWAFFIREVIYSLLRIISDETQSKKQPRQQKVSLVVDDDLFLPCCNLIHYVCKAAVECCSQEFGSHLHVITSTLTPYALGEDERAEKALQLLNFLIVDCSDNLCEAIGCLDPFPDTAKFKQINKRYKQIRKDRTSLREEITHFLMTDSSSSPLSRLEGLRLLRQSIENKHQLVDLVNGAEVAQGKSVSGPVTDLVHDLIKLGSLLTSCEGDQAKVVLCEAANCLGEIGPVDLSTVSLGCRNKPDSLSVKSEKYTGDSGSQRNYAIVMLLNSYLVDKDVGVVIAAASCLKKILATVSGCDLLKKFEAAKQEQLLYYLEPFRPSKKKRSSGAASAMETDLGLSDVQLEASDLWIPGFDGQEYSHEQWLTRLACTLIESGFVQDEILLILSPMCKTKVEFTEHVFPYLIHNILECGDDAIRTTLSGQFRNFFNHCNGISVIPSRANSPLPTVVSSSSFSGVKKESVRTMLAVVTYLRTQNLPKKGRGQSTLWDNNFWLDLDYLEVASAAQRCSAYFTALLYTEIWADIQKSKPDSPVFISLPSNSQNLEMEVVTSQSSEESLSTSYQTLVLEAYGSIGEPDSMYGAGAGRLADIDSRVRTYMHEQAWDKALGACDLRMQNISGSSQTVLLQSMKNFGLDHVMRMYLKGLSSENRQATAEVAELQYESAWQNCVWDLDTSSSVGSDTTQGFHQSLYSCLCALQEEEWELFQCTLDNAKLHVMDDIAHASLESVRSVYPSLSRLQCIVELENFGSIINSTEDSIVDNWNERFPLPDNDFEFLEPVLALRTSMLQTLVTLRRIKSHSPEKLAQAYKDLAIHLEMQAKKARWSHNPQVAEKALFRLRQLQGDITEIQSRLGGRDLGVSWSWKMEEAKLRWARGEQDTAMYLLKSLTRNLEQTQDQSSEVTDLYPQALGLYGTWLAESKSENPNTIIEKYLEKAACLMDCMEETNQASKIEAFLSLAWFADTQYQKKVDFMSSSIYENKENLMKKSKVESEKLQQMYESGKDRYTRTLNLQAQMDERELQQVAQDKRTFLKTAVEYYIKTLETGDKYDMRVFRLCSLWFDNANEESVSEMIKTGLMKIQSRKFLPLMYQLAARLGTKSHDNRLFQGILNELIERTAVEHPHHTLFILLALANAEKDDKYLTAGKKNTSRLTRNNSKGGAKGFTEARIQTACTLIERIGQKRGELVKHMQLLCEAYIELAYVNVTHLKSERGPFNLPDVTIKRISNLREVPVPTVEVKVDPLCRYDDLVHVMGFDSKFWLAGGVNLPKIIFCIGSDGVKRRQLVKGRDDLRQDAVMEQVFGMVNQLLIKNSETRKRKLKMRTYKVIPLSQRSGIVEWCENTVPLGEYLIGRPGTKTGAHPRYYPGDWTSLDCRKKIQAGDNSGRPRYVVYQELMEHFHPVFRHFFLEKFPDPAVWFERRLSYTRGVATSSIVGYVVGLGDRHVQNILVDCNTAELVHIDLGVAFEQGKFLPTPETVPFRLTRDMVDGMGLTGVEGVCRRCCEKTMEVMRTSHESLMTVVEVLLYDPLSSWTLSPEKRKALQQKAEEDDLPSVSAVGDCLDSTIGTENLAVEDNVNKMAKRMLLRLKQKLDGVEDGVHLSVSGQVNHLIREAMDPKNLCRLFAGWQPWV